MEGERVPVSYLVDLVTTTTTSAYFAGEVTYPLLAGTQPDLYRCFMVRTLSNLSGAGTAGLIHPDTHFTGKREGRLRSAAYRALRFHAHFTNERKIFQDIDYHVPFGLHIYAQPRTPSFTHISWLFDPATLKSSLMHDGHGELPGIKHEGSWDIRPHKSRLVRVGEAVLHEWSALSGTADTPLSEAALLYPVTNEEANAISVLAETKLRTGSYSPWISRGFDEKAAKDEGYIEWNTSTANEWSDVVLQGPHFGVASPLNKQPNIPCKSNKDYEPWDLVKAPADAVPRTNYRRPAILESTLYLSVQEARDGVRHAEHYRLAWREMISQSSVRSLFAAIIPPGPAHINAVRSMVINSNRALTLIAGMWASIPLDYYLRITGAGHMDVSVAVRLAAPQLVHPLATPLLLRSARLNCVTSAFATLWRDINEPDWRDEQWAAAWPETVTPIGAVTPVWQRESALRTELDRRAALVEIDALIAVWLGMTIEQFMAIYNARYGVLSSYENDMFFDARGRQITREYYGQGVGQAPETYPTLIKHLQDLDNTPPPEGYVAPFYKADREREMREAHAVFQRRLDEAVARGEWDPVTQSVPQREVPPSP